MGPVAQETLKNYPELVKQFTIVASGSPDTTLLAVSEIPQPILIKAIQELDVKVKSLEARVAELEKAVGTPPLGGIQQIQTQESWFTKFIDWLIGLFK